jgi:hypothetical protein
VISGRALGFVFPIRKLDSRGREIIPGDDVLAKEAELAKRLFEVAIRCKAVICCRVSPKQKSQVRFFQFPVFFTISFFVSLSHFASLSDTLSASSILFSFWDWY